MRTSSSVQKLNLIEMIVLRSYGMSSIVSADEHVLGPISLCCDHDCRVDQPPSAAGYRISDGGESRFCENKIGSHRLRFSDDQRRGLAAKAKKLGRKLLAVVATMRYTRNTVGIEN